jgi:hypothetical protein
MIATLLTIKKHVHPSRAIVTAVDPQRLAKENECGADMPYLYSSSYWKEIILWNLTF